MHGLLRVVLAAAVLAGSAHAVSGGEPYHDTRSHHFSGPHHWSGLYVGGHIGAGWSEGVFTDDSDDTTSFDFDSTIIGAHIGYNLQFRSIVIGIEGDYTAALDMEDRGPPFGGPNNFFRQVGIDDMATIRGRLGYAHGSWLFYGTGGIAWVSMDFLGTQGEDKKTRVDETTWVAGGGLEYSPVKNLYFRTEYLHIGLDETLRSPKFEDDPGGYKADPIDIVRFGVSVGLN